MINQTYVLCMSQIHSTKQTMYLSYDSIMTIWGIIIFYEFDVQISRM